MKAHLFDLDFSRWEIVLLLFVPACINFLIFIYVLLLQPKTKNTSYFSLFVFVLGMWQALEGMMRFSIKKETATEWLKLSELVALFVIPFGIQFILSLTKWDKNKMRWGITLLLYLPTVVFFLLVELKIDEYEIVPSETFNWVANPVPTDATLSKLIWLAFGALSMITLLWLYFIITKKGSNEKKQSFLLAMGLTIPVTGGIIFEILFPLFFKIDEIPVTVPLLTIFSLTSIIAIKKFKMLTFSPRHQWDKIMQKMSDGVVILDFDNKIKYANKAFCKLTEYGIEEIVGKDAFDLFITEKEKIHDTASIHNTKKTPDQHELEVKNKHGKKIIVLVNSAPYSDNKERVIGTIYILTNISYLKKTERILKYNEARLKQAQEVGHMGCWELNLSNGRATWSDEACKIYGLPIEEANNQSFEKWISFIHPDDLEQVKREIDVSQKNLSDSSFRHRIIRKDNSLRYIHTVVKFEFNESGQPTGLFGICYDITNAMETQHALIESEHNLRTFINESPLSIFFVDPKSKKILYSNLAFSDLLGYSAEEMKSMTIYNFINHSVQNVDDRIKEVLTEGRIKNSERQWKKKDGKILHVWVTTFHHRWNGSEAIYVAAHDISERKKVEDKLKSVNHELETFIYKASHDIRGPLASIIGLVNISKSEKLDSPLRQYLDMIGSATQKLDHNLIELMNAMYIKNIKVFEDKIDFNTLISDILTRFKHYPGFERIQIKQFVEVRREFISNKGIIETLLQNLIENAIKYQKKDGGDPVLNITITENHEEITVTVEDNGIGIEYTAQEKVFDMYYRANGSTDGSGLGLYLVKKGIERLNGKIELISTPGNGTTFTITLPTSNNKLK